MTTWADISVVVYMIFGSTHLEKGEYHTYYTWTNVTTQGTLNWMLDNPSYLQKITCEDV